MIIYLSLYFGVAVLERGLCISLACAPGGGAPPLDFLDASENYLSVTLSMKHFPKTVASLQRV